MGVRSSYVAACMFVVLRCWGCRNKQIRNQSLVSVFYAKEQPLVKENSMLCPQALVHWRLCSAGGVRPLSKRPREALMMVIMADNLGKQMKDYS